MFINCQYSIVIDIILLSHNGVLKMMVYEVHISDAYVHIIILTHITCTCLCVSLLEASLAYELINLYILLCNPVFFLFYITLPTELPVESFKFQIILEAFLLYINFLDG